VAKVSSISASQRSLVVLTGIVAGALVIGCLYWARAVFIPLALAIFLAFLLSPIVLSLQRLRIPRPLAVCLVVLGATALLGGLMFLVSSQFTELLEGLPRYTENIRSKVHSIQEWQIVRRLEDVSKSVEETLNPEAARREKAPSPSFGSETGLLQWIGSIGSVGEGLAAAGLTMVLVIFILLRREDLRNRFIRLVGQGRVTTTTKAVDEAGKRISHYLFTQAMVNGSYGLILAIVLYLIGVKYAILWGFLVGLFRYIPYVGIWIAALLPISFSLAMFEGWLQPLLVLAAILAMEFLAYLVVEPVAYGQSMGVSEVALLVSAAFWTFLWGPVGLILSNPLTVCLVVLGRYVPQLEFLKVLLGEEPVLEPSVAFYQRLLAKDQDEAADIVLEELRKTRADKIYDGLLIPALTMALRDRDRGTLSKADEEFVVAATQEILDDFGETQVREDPQIADNSGEKAKGPQRAPVRILGCPARSSEDQLALEMLRHLLDPAKCDLQTAKKDMLSSELVAYVERISPAAICVATLPPGGLAHTRYLCKRLRAHYPNLRIIVGHWGLTTDRERVEQFLRQAGADHLSVTLVDTRDQIIAWLPVFNQDATAAPRMTISEPQQKAAV
jgi:predicted PurR-regulated permease PerM